MQKLVDMTKRIPMSRFVFFWIVLVILVGLLISLTLSKKDEMKINSEYDSVRNVKNGTQ